MREDTIQLSCPHCWELAEIQVESPLSHTVVVEDCSVCCHPMRIEVWWTEDGEASCTVSSANE